MYTLFQYVGITNDQYTYGDIYGVYKGKWQYVHSFNEWQILSPLNKEKIFKECSQQLPEQQILNQFTPFKMLTYANNDQARQFNINFIPKNQLLIMKDLIDLSQIDRILSIRVNTIENKGLIYLLLTNGIKNDNNKIVYYTYKINNENNLPLNQWTPVLEFDGDNYYWFNNDNFGNFTARDLFSLSAEDIEKLFTNIDESKLGFAFLYVPLEENAQLKVDDIDIDVDAKGVWESTQVGVDYTYCYLDSTHISITIKNQGKYKINYFA